MTGSIDWVEVLQCRECLVPCVGKDSKADVNDWLKGVPAFGRAKDHSVKAEEVAESAGVWKRMVIQVYQQCLKSQSTGNCAQFSLELCQGKHPPNLA